MVLIWWDSFCNLFFIDLCKSDVFNNKIRDGYDYKLNYFGDYNVIYVFFDDIEGSNGNN